jgi:hypothetical protein
VELRLKILISFCNQVFAPEFSLGLLDPECGEFRWVELQESKHASGVSGLCKSGGFVYAGIQASGRGPRLHIYDEARLELVSAYQFEHVVDVHSLLALDDNTLLVASTGTDELYIVELHKFTEIRRERLYWRVPGSMIERGDQCHVNSAAITEHGLAVSYCFSKRGVPMLSPTDAGGIMLIEDGSILRDGLLGPHTVVQSDSELFFCHQTGLVSSLNGKSAETGGYSRGLCIVEGQLFVGGSGQRWRSRSTNRALPVDEEEFASTGASVTVLDADSFEKRARFDLRPFGREIYDLLPVEVEIDSAYVVGGDPVAVRSIQLERLLYRYSLSHPSV